MVCDRRKLKVNVAKNKMMVSSRDGSLGVETVANSEKLRQMAKVSLFECKCK